MHNSDYTYAQVGSYQCVFTPSTSSGSGPWGVTSVQEPVTFGAGDGSRHFCFSQVGLDKTAWVNEINTPQWSERRWMMGIKEMCRDTFWTAVLNHTFRSMFAALLWQQGIIYHSVSCSTLSSATDAWYLTSLNFNCRCCWLLPITGANHLIIRWYCLISHLIKDMDADF